MACSYGRDSASPWPFAAGSLSSLVSREWRASRSVPLPPAPWRRAMPWPRSIRDERVRAESERFVAVKLDFTKESPETKQKMESYEIKGLPTVIFLDSTGKEVQRFFGFRDADAVLALMQSVR